MTEPAIFFNLRMQAAHELRAIEEDGAFVGLSRRHVSADPRSERRLTDLVSGVTRYRRWLDFLVDSYYINSKYPLDTKVRIVLRLGIYELLNTQTPPHAVIFECVEVAKRLVGKKVSGLVNGLLRTVDRKRNALPDPNTGDPVTDLAIRHSHPDWMVQRWTARYGPDDAERFLLRNNARPLFGVRVRGIDREDAMRSVLSLDPEAIRSPFFENYVRLRHMQPVLRSGLLESQQLLVQDEGAGGVVASLDPQPGERILDLCAAPGGKTITIADRVGPSGYVTAVDVHASRLNMLRLEAARLSLTQIETVVADAVDYVDPGGQGRYDRVLVDAPCSGLGVLSKRADLRWRQTEGGICDLTKLQSKILQSAARHVKPEGILVYSTCTTEPEENEGVASAFLASNPEFVRENLLEVIPDSMPTQLVTESGDYQTVPFQDEIDGAYAVRFRLMNADD